MAAKEVAGWAEEVEAMEVEAEVLQVKVTEPVVRQAKALELLVQPAVVREHCLPRAGVRVPAWVAALPEQFAVVQGWQGEGFVAKLESLQTCEIIYEKAHFHQLIAALLNKG